jgi:hypothetical protein
MSTGVFKMVDGETIELTEEENAERVSAAEAAQAEWDAEAWLRGRLEEYGGWTDQLDEMFHDFDAWKTRVQSVKDKYPKPE